MPERSRNAELFRLHAVVHGHVQGVNFRAYTARRATALGLTGWIRNLPDGTVETVAEGLKNRLDEMLEFLHNGPPSAQVTRVEVQWQPAYGEFADFRVRHYWD